MGKPASYRLPRRRPSSEEYPATVTGLIPVHQQPALARLVPAEMIGFWNPVEDLDNHHDLLIANMSAQAKVLAFGRDEAGLKRAGSPSAQIPHRVCPGNRSATLIPLDRMTPENLGKLIALYEHRMFIEGTIWGIDSFD